MFDLLRHIFSPTARIEARLARIEHKLDLLLERAGVTAHSMPPAVINMLRIGRKQEAIQYYRDSHGVSQHDAELAVNAFLQGPASVQSSPE